MEAYSQRELDIARLAAYIDGEGTINIEHSSKGRHGNRAYKLRLSIPNTDPRLPLWCRDNFGGQVRVNHKASARRRELLVWVIGQKSAAALLAECLPFFVIKREQAELGIAFGETFINENRSRKGLPEQVRNEREDLRTKMVEIHKFRPDPEVKSA